MSRPPTQREKDEINAGADALLYPGGGGVAIWVRRDELMPRAAIRFRTPNPSGEDIPWTDVATICATLRVGLERVQHVMADDLGIERELFARMVGTAFDVLMPKYQMATEIRR